MLAASLPALALALAGTTQSPTSALAARARIAAVPCVHREPRARAAASMGLFGWRGAAEEDDQAGDARAPRRGRGGRGEAVDAPVARTTWAERGVNADSANPAKFEADEDDSYGGYVIERRAPPRATRAAAVAPSRRRARPAGSGRAGSYAEGLDGDGAYYGDVVRNVYAEPLVSLADFDESGRPLSPPVGAEYDADGYEIGSPGDPRMADFARNVRAEGDWRLNLYSSWLRLWGADESYSEPNGFFPEAVPLWETDRPLAPSRRRGRAPDQNFGEALDDLNDFGKPDFGKPGRRGRAQGRTEGAAQQYGYAGGRGPSFSLPPAKQQRSAASTAEGGWEEQAPLYGEEYADEYEDDQWTGDAAQQQQRVSELPDLDEEKDPVTGISPGFSSPTSRAPPLARPASAKLQGRPLPRRQPSAQAYERERDQYGAAPSQGGRRAGLPQQQRRSAGPSTASLLAKLEALKQETERTAQRLGIDEQSLLSAQDDAQLRSEALALLTAQLSKPAAQTEVELLPESGDPSPPVVAAATDGRLERAERQVVRLDEELARIEAELESVRERLTIAQSGVNQVNVAIATGREGGGAALARLATSTGSEVSPSFQSYLRRLPQLPGRPAPAR
mmetsp:Transcript_24448/g.56592  ORF Transcript_24448/g.56592 Transcript_24448/m.56592 type:complete len:620 (-) Transcript_24448:240-2099(-)